MKYIWLTKNLCKMAIWIVLAPTIVSYFGMLYGAISYVLLILGWQIVVTLIREYQLKGRDGVRVVLRALLSRPLTLLTVYGCYCSPKYGMDGTTNGLPAIDQLDEACKCHDEAMQAAKLLEYRAEHTAKNAGDLQFMWDASTSDNRASGIYLLGLGIGFVLRILGRAVFK
jgi:hypothetical protein